MKWFALGFAVFVLVIGAAVSGRATATSPARGDTPQQRDAVALVTANVASALTYYDLQWDDPPHVLSVSKAPNGDSVVLEEVRMSTSSYDNTVSPAHMRFVLRGVVSPKDWLRGGRVKVIKAEHFTPRKAGAA